MTISIFKDNDIRSALHAKINKLHGNDPDTIVLDELGLLQGTCRVDVVVVNGVIHGYEIKSDADNLARLPSQRDAYGKVLDFATLVVGESHLNDSLKIIPDWWEVKVATAAKNNSVKFTIHRKGKKNPGIDPRSLVELLWRDEVSNALLERGFKQKELRRPKDILYDMLSETIPLNELRDMTRFILKNRTAWRDRTQPLLCVD